MASTVVRRDFVAGVGRRLAGARLAVHGGGFGGQCLTRLTRHGGRALRMQMRERFYPARAEWKVMAVYQSNAMLTEALDGLSRVST